MPPTDADVLAVLRGHADTAWGVAWSPSGAQLATSSTDGTGAVWDLRPRAAESHLVDTRGRVFRTLSEKERTRHMLPPGPV
ncbi:hypothetical protein [Streptomyces qinglanensis]|uniref:WD40 repeat domain-containing protein n=1 Tax=Streptomyces qinglanensis TaxID=943816 RepID=UPI003D72F2B3